MVQSLAISNLTLPELEEKQNLKLTDDPEFFAEWHEALPELSDEEKRYLEQVQQEYFDQTRMGQISEGLIKLIVVSPLLHLAGFYRYPFEVRLEEPVQIEVTEANELWRGRIDALVIKDFFWVLVVEAKNSVFGIDRAIPQALGYMLATPHPARLTYGLVTNGSSFAFIKLIQEPQPRYDVSDVMLLLPGRNVLFKVLQVMKQIGRMTGE
ncbi:type I restriction endonuclease subunit R [Oculatella sp. FACHB-28]|uniref:type I restriction endonuclease subunit R n=1 Tax=Oculatella sp. FACHB-28 TaxID=2692845 RepID=UPI0016886F45|nr:type I restriction endonuclease subunit R [Oculatella sp. FACHB-28]MBD2057859.1 type I restriction endonuclease subunit R [Oculatella sp. FACHB-28]